MNLDYNGRAMEEMIVAIAAIRDNVEVNGGGLVRATTVELLGLDGGFIHQIHPQLELHADWGGVAPRRLVQSFQTCYR